MTDDVWKRTQEEILLRVARRDLSVKQALRLLDGGVGEELKTMGQRVRILTDANKSLESELRDVKLQATANMARLRELQDSLAEARALLERVNYDETKYKAERKLARVLRALTED